MPILVPEQRAKISTVLKLIRLGYTGWPDTLGPPGIEPFALVRKLMTVFLYRVYQKKTRPLLNLRLREKY